MIIVYDNVAIVLTNSELDTMSSINSMSMVSQSSESIIRSKFQHNVNLHSVINSNKCNAFFTA